METEKPSHVTLDWPISDWWGEGLETIKWERGEGKKCAQCIVCFYKMFELSTSKWKRGSDPWIQGLSCGRDNSQKNKF